MSVTVAIPVKDGGSLLERLLEAVRAQVVDRDVELLVCDSGSRDGSAERARDHGATVIEIAAAQFSHGGTRNLLMERASGEHVAFLTQDAIPLGTGWLQTLLDGFAVADDVGLVFGPYRARPDASPVVARELADWFESFAPSGAPRVDRLAPGEELADPRALLGPRAFFTDANGCVSRAAWERVPFRAAPYAEDHLLALDMLAAGYAKVFQPTAAVEHSHEYAPLAWFRRCFDEWRGLREVYGHVEPVRAVPRNLRGQVRADGLRSLPHWGIRAAGALAGSRADRFPPRVRRAMSLERRASFEPAAPPIRHTPAP